MHLASVFTYLSKWLHYIVGTDFNHVSSLPATLTSRIKSYLSVTKSPVEIFSVSPAFEPSGIKSYSGGAHAEFFRPEGTMREYVFKMCVESADSEYPVIFDTGSPHIWVASDSLVHGGFRFVSKSTDSLKKLTYLGGTVDCVLNSERLLFLGKKSSHSWKETVCVAGQTSLGLTGYVGVLGADLSSQFVKNNPIFWLSNLLYLGDTECTDGRSLVNIALSGRYLTENHWEFEASVTVGKDTPVPVYVSPDTGALRLYVGESIWNRLRVLWSEVGIRLLKLTKNGSPYISNSAGCGNMMDKMPSIIIHINQSKSITVSPIEYMKVVGSICIFYVTNLPRTDGNLILMGSSILTKMNTRWDAAAKTFGVCL